MNIFMFETQKQTFIDVPHDSGVVNRARHHEVPIPRPADVVHVFYVTPRNKTVDRKYFFEQEMVGLLRIYRFYYIFCIRQDVKM